MGGNGRTPRDIVKIAIAGKGGTGKTTFSGTLARELGRSGRRVLAIDADPNPTLAMTLGIDESTASEASVLPRDLIAAEPGGGAWAYRLTIPVGDIVRALGLSGPDGVTLLTAGRVEHAARGCMCGTHAVVRTILRALGPDDADIVLVDMEAGVEHLSRAGGTLAFADALVVLVEPFYKSHVTARSLAALSSELGIPLRLSVTNKSRGEADEEATRELCDATGLEQVGTIPFDPILQEAEARGVAPIDHDPNAPGVVAARRLAHVLVERVGGPGRRNQAAAAPGASPSV